MSSTPCAAPPSGGCWRRATASRASSPSARSSPRSASPVSRSRAPAWAPCAAVTAPRDRPDFAVLGEIGVFVTEVELTPKTPARLVSIMLAWREATWVRSVRYVCVPGPTERAVRRAVARTRSRRQGEDLRGAAMRRRSRSDRRLRPADSCAGVAPLKPRLGPRSALASGSGSGSAVGRDLATVEASGNPQIGGSEDHPRPSC
jgi:hypothetical protein